MPLLSRSFRGYHQKWNTLDHILLLGEWENVVYPTKSEPLWLFNRGNFTIWYGNEAFSNGHNILWQENFYKFSFVGILQCLWQIRKGPNVCKMCAQQLRLQNMSLNQHGSDAWSSDSKSSDREISDESSDKNSDWVCWAFPARTLWSALAFSRVLWIAKSTENFHHFFKSSFSIPTLQWCPRYELQVPMKGEGMGGIHWAARS